jgi:hypothetical protein
MIPFVIQIIQLRFITDGEYMKPKDIIIRVMLLKVFLLVDLLFNNLLDYQLEHIFYILSYTSLDGTGKTITNKRRIFYPNK